MPGDLYEGWDRPRQDGVWGRVQNPMGRRKSGHIDRVKDGSGDAPETVHEPGAGRPPEDTRLAPDFGSNGDLTRTYRGRGSPPRPSKPFQNAPGPRHHHPESVAHPPEPGQHPSFDAKVAAEFLRLRDAKSKDTNTATSGGRRGRGVEINPPRYLAGPTARTSSVGPPQDFESDVERAMRHLEHQLTAQGAEGRVGSLEFASRAPAPRRDSLTAGTGQGQDLNSDGSDVVAAGAVQTSSPLTPAGNGLPFSAPLPPPAPQPEADRHGGILSQIDMHRVATGGGHGRTGGLRDMWGGSEGYIAGDRKYQQRRHGGGLASMWHEGKDAHDDEARAGGRGLSSTRRQGPGLKGMWGGDDPTSASVLPPERKGPGLRALWSGPDTVAADAARSKAQAAYLRALDRDVQERRAFEGVSQPHRPTRDQRNGRDSSNSSGGGDFSGGGGGSTREHGTSLAGIGATSDVAVTTPRGTPRQRWRSEGSGDVHSRLVEKAKKAAYAEELRKQIAEKEARKALDDNAPTGVRRRASTGGWGGHDHGHATPQPYMGGGVQRSNGADAGAAQPPSNGFPLQNGSGGHESPLQDTDRGRDVFSPTWLTPPANNVAVDTAMQQMADLSCSGNGEARVTAARRRLVEDVYGGGGMGAALSGSGYRRASTGSHGVVGSSSGGTGVDKIGDGDSAAAVSANGTMHVRTGAGVQSLAESEQDDKWQRRAAALEQQRALQEQIAAKSWAKKQEEEARKREEEEDARQQRERMRQVKADADEDRRRKQAEQQEQLQGLYRQQEEALRKKRGPTHRQSDSGRAAGTDHRESYGALPYTMGVPDCDAGHSLGVDVGAGPRQSQTKLPMHDTTDGGVAEGAARQSPRRRSGFADVDELPAGAHARAEILRSSPVPVGNASASSPSWRPGSSNSNTPAGTSKVVSRGRRGASPANSRRDGDVAKLKVDPALVATEQARVADGCDGRYGTESGRADEGGADLTGLRGASGSSLVFPAAAQAGRERLRPSASDGEPPLRTRSSLVPVSSATLFPPNPADASAEVVAGNATTESEACGLRTSSAVGVNGSTTRGSAAVAADGSAMRGAPQDEMDAFVTSWQTEHLRRRSHRWSLNQTNPPQRDTLGGSVAKDGYPRSPSAPTISRSPPRDLLRSSRARSTNDAGTIFGNADELEDSLVATSRMIDPSLPLLPPVGVAGAVGGRRRRRSVGQGLAGNGADPSEQSLTSDSMLFYLSGQQQEPTGAPAPSSATAGSGKKTQAGATSRFRRTTREVGVCGQALGNKGREATGAPSLATSLSSPGRGLGQQQEDNEHGQMSPLTRLLAETPVRLAAGGPYVNHDGDAVFGRDVEVNGAGHGAAGADHPTTFVTSGSGRASGDGSDPRGVAKARRTRATWGRPERGENHAVPEALRRTGGGGGGGGVPWEDMSEGRTSSSGAP